MTTKKSVALAPSRYESVGEQRFVGLALTLHKGDSARISAQWRDFMSGPYHQITSRLDCPPVGITVPEMVETKFIYICAAQVSRFGRQPAGLTEFTIAPVCYAVFSHDGPVTELPLTYAAIWNEWFPSSGRRPKRAASLEHHNPTFDPRTGTGGVAVWIPLT